MGTISDKRDDQRIALEQLGAAMDAAKRQLDRLWKLHETEFGTDGEYIRDGGFTDAGRKRLRQMFGDGRRNMEIAAFFGVSDSAIAYQRKRWMQLDASKVIR